MKRISIAIAIVAICTSGSQADITNSFSSTDYASTSGDWLTNTTEDIDGNGLGTDGFLFFGDFDGTQENNQPFTHAVASLPGYATVASGADFLSIADEFGGYGEIDNPLLLDGTDGTGGTIVARNGTGLPAGDFIDDVMSFTISGLTAGDLLRVGVLSAIEASGDGRWDPTSITLTDGTFTETVGDHAANPLALDGDGAGTNVGWVFFDIDIDGTYTLQGTKRLAGNQGVGFGGLTFDTVSVIPEPGSLAFLGLGLIGVALRRRK